MLDVGDWLRELGLRHRCCGLNNQGICLQQHILLYTVSCRPSMTIKSIYTANCSSAHIKKKGLWQPQLPKSQAYDYHMTLIGCLSWGKHGILSPGHQILSLLQRAPVPRMPQGKITNKVQGLGFRARGLGLEA